jgi:hypothetical protein
MLGGDTSLLSLVDHSFSLYGYKYIPTRICLALSRSFHYPLVPSILNGPHSLSSEGESVFRLRNFNIVGLSTFILLRYMFRS